MILRKIQMKGCKRMNLKVENSCEKKDIEKGIRGITLIVLVVTIVILLILAGVTIATLTGENGILTRAIEAKNKTKNLQAEELSSIRDRKSVGRERVC